MKPFYIDYPQEKLRSISMPIDASIEKYLRLSFLACLKIMLRIVLIEFIRESGRNWVHV